MPSVSVCIPVHNGERFIAETVRSVLDQTYRDFEMVVLDNASTDDTGSVARSFTDPRVRVQRTPSSLSLPDNWNRAVQLSRAPLVKLMCADDLLHPRCLELQVAPMEADPGLAVVAARRHMIDEYSRVIVPRRGLSGLVGVRTGVEVARRVVRLGTNPIGEGCNVLFRREDFAAAGGFRAERQHIMDLDMWMRLLQYGEFLGLPETLAAFRIRNGSTSGENGRHIDAEQRTLAKELGESSLFQVRGIDAVIGRVFGPVGRARRRALFAVSRGSRKRDRVDA
jgi:glycosyltransferase involved in cell wall biosynthesis